MTQTQTDIVSWALVVDDHPLFCDALSLTVRSVADISQVRTADCLEEALKVIAEHGRPDLIILDLNLPDVNGLEGLVRLTGSAVGTPILIVSSLADCRVVSGAIRLGAAGYVPKRSSRAVILAALEAVGRGETYLPEGFARTRNETELVDASRRLASLTNQQRRILDLICEGKLNKQIAYDLSIAETTVKAHMTAIMRKLVVYSRTQAVVVARQALFESHLPSADH